MKKKLLALAMASTMVLTCFTGCGSSSNDAKKSDSSKTAEKKDVSLTVWGAEEDQTMLGEMIESFKKEYADKANWKLAEDVGDLMIHPAADAAGTVYEQAVKASGCQYYVIANVTAQ